MANVIIYIFCVSTVLFVTFGENTKDEIIMAHIIYRHGDRSPILNFKTNYYNESSWPQGFGQLTSRGMKQHYELGKFFREKYILGKHKLLNQSYDNHEINIRSTDVDRTLMSAYSNLAGLYPPEGAHIWDEKLLWQPIPVHTVPKFEDNLLYMSSECPKYDKIYKEILKSDEVNNLREEYKEFFAFVANKTQKLDLDISNIWEINDVIFCESQHNFTLPDWVHERFNGKYVFDILNDMNSIQFDLQYNRREEARLKGGSLLSKIRNDIESMVEKNKEVKKAYIYSTHDDTLSAFMSSLNIFNRISPPYAACIMVDVFQNKMENGTINHHVVVSYKNSSEESFSLRIPGCDVKCPLEEFQKLSKDNALSDWKQDCQIDGSTTIPDYINITILASLGILVVILLVICVTIAKKKRGSIMYSQI